MILLNIYVFVVVDKLNLFFKIWFFKFILYFIGVFILFYSLVWFICYEIKNKI